MMHRFCASDSHKSSFEQTLKFNNPPSPGSVLQCMQVSALRGWCRSTATALLSGRTVEAPGEGEEPEASGHGEDTRASSVSVCRTAFACRLERTCFAAIMRL